MNSTKKIVDIIIPVYAGLQETLACIESVCESLVHLKTRVELVVIFDAGPDLALRDRLLELASRGVITLLINETNLGFVRCINRGIDRSQRDVLLLNSDTLVSNDWLDRMVKHAYVSSNISTVTPFSNNAEICSWPQICEVTATYDGYSPTDIDQAFATLDSPPVQIPTAVGFCMFVKRECIDRIGLFDAESFGRGYGEENDFCMRAAALNFTHVLATNVYVHHHGAVSFGDEKRSLTSHAMEVLDRKYPSYHAQVARHIADDPARRWRFAAELVLRSQQGTPAVLHISHGIGGGTDRHIVELAAFSSGQQQHAMLVPQATCMRLVFPNVNTGGLFEFPFDDPGALKNFLFALSLSRIHIHHVKGWEERIYDLLKLLDVPYDITLHDYYFLHINPAMADKRGYYCADPRQRDAQSADAIPFQAGMNAGKWREQWKSLLYRAERIFAPSNAAAAIYNHYHPSLKIICAFHPDSELAGSYPLVYTQKMSAAEPMHVVVIGALSVIKGANMLEKVSQLAARQRKSLRFTLIGYAYKKLASTVVSTGAYKDSELQRLLTEQEPDLVWFPCTWPETYSYTLSAALEQGLPVVCPNIGSFPERLHNRPLTWVEQWDLNADQWLQKLEEIHMQLLAAEASLPWPSQPVTQFSYRKDYVQARVIPEIEMVAAEYLMRHWLTELPEASTVNRRFYRVLIWLNSHRLFGHIANLIPMWIRRSVKRRLSTRPIHE